MTQKHIDHETIQQALDSALAMLDKPQPPFVDDGRQALPMILVALRLAKRLSLERDAADEQSARLLAEARDVEVWLRSELTQERETTEQLRQAMAIIIDHTIGEGECECADNNACFVLINQLADHALLLQHPDACEHSLAIRDGSTRWCEECGAVLLSGTSSWRRPARSSGHLRPHPGGQPSPDWARGRDVERNLVLRLISSTAGQYKSDGWHKLADACGLLGSRIQDGAHAK
jgi:hypothetical protein